jgi:UDP-N-acetyl-D-mannosaminuronic acid dehydrogenase
VDPWFIVHSAPDVSRLINTARQINDCKPHYVVDRVIQRAHRFTNPVIACLGLSYKADIDDFRESPALDIVQELATRNTAQILVSEPHINHLPESLSALPNVELCPFATAVQRSDIVVLLVGHRQFRQIDRRLLMEKIIIDTRGVWR